MSHLRVKIILLVLLCSFSNFSCSQSSLKLFFIQDPDMPSQAEFVKKNKLEVYQIFYQQFFTTDDKLDKEKLKKQIEIKFPDEKSGGYGVLDWEGEAIEVFKKQDDKAKFEYYIQQFVESLKYAKSIRPNVKWGFYHLPYLSYWDKHGSKASDRSYNLSEIYQNEDFIAPSLYTYFPEDSHDSTNISYLRNNLKLSLEIGKKYNKPVIPFVWHRTHPGNKRLGMSLLPVEYFSETIEEIKNADYEGVKVYGVFWWHSESYNFRNQEKHNSLSKEYSNVNDLQNYQFDLFQKYFESIKDILK